jgi:hypothetical protein
MDGVSTELDEMDGVGGEREKTICGVSPENITCGLLLSVWGER